MPLATKAGDDLLRGLRRWDVYGRLGWLDIKRRYRRTVFGPLWGVVSVALMIAALGSVGVGLWDHDAATYLPFLASGLIVWVLISTMMTEACTVFVFGQNFLREMRFDYSILAYALVWRNLIAFLHNLAIYVLAIVIMAPDLLRPASLLAIPGIALVLVNGAWIALVFGVFCLRFRDIQQLVGTLIQISIFITPIFWSPDDLRGTFRFILVTPNPIYHLIEVVRAPLMGLAPPMSSYIAVLVMAVAGWIIAYLVFSRFRSRLSYWS